ncbi:cytochrome P450 [Streptomyces sp. NPDC005529]|uniref:cytochrome P450 n=1 Tax=unclassified Streptomyces TaxID=2593676 RepID=UPI0033B6F58F
MPQSTPHDFPFARHNLLDISPQLDRLRTEEPVSQVRLASGDVAWLVTRYEDVKFVLGDPRFSMHKASDEDAPELMPMVKLYPGLFSLDGVEHTLSRRLLARALRRRDTEAFRGGLAKTADDLSVQLAAASPPADLLDDFCAPLVSKVACELLGLTSKQLELFRAHFRPIITIGALASVDIEAHWEPLRDLVLGLLDARRSQPSHDMISDLITENTGDRVVTDANLIGLTFSLISSLGNTPLTQLSYGLATLLNHPDQWQLLVNQPELINSATAEILRYGVAFEVEHIRIANENVEVAGARIAAGDAVLTSIAAANRDSSHFTNGARFDITNTVTRHLAFGHGPHLCAGADLGHHMLRSSLLSLTRLLPDLRLAVPHRELTLREKDSHSFSLGSVPVRW